MSLAIYMLYTWPHMIQRYDCTRVVRLLLIFLANAINNFFKVAIVKHVTVNSASNATEIYCRVVQYHYYPTQMEIWFQLLSWYILYIITKLTSIYPAANTHVRSLDIRPYDRCGSRGRRLRPSIIFAINAISVLSSQ